LDGAYLLHGLPFTHSAFAYSASALHHPTPLRDDPSLPTNHLFPLGVSTPIMQPLRCPLRLTNPTSALRLEASSPRSLCALCRCDTCSRWSSSLSWRRAAKVCSTLTPDSRLAAAMALAGRADGSSGGTGSMRRRSGSERSGPQRRRKAVKAPMLALVALRGVPDEVPSGSWSVADALWRQGVGPRSREQWRYP
jgi:hypothetical protein